MAVVEVVVVFVAVFVVVAAAVFIVVVFAVGVVVVVVVVLMTVVISRPLTDIGDAFRSPPSQTLNKKSASKKTCYKNSTPTRNGRRCTSLSKTSRFPS